VKNNFPVFFFLFGIFVINLCYIIREISLFHIIREISLFPLVYYPAPATINITIYNILVKKTGNFFIDFQRQFIYKQGDITFIYIILRYHIYNDVKFILIISKEKPKTVAGKDWCI